MAPRVGVAAHHQANAVLRLLLGKAPEAAKLLSQERPMFTGSLVRHAVLGLGLALCCLAGCRHLEIAPDDKWPEVIV